MPLPEGRKPLTNQELLNLDSLHTNNAYVAVTTIKTYVCTYLIDVNSCSQYVKAVELVEDELVDSISCRYLGEQVVATETVSLSQAVEIFDYECPQLAHNTVSQKRETIQGCLK
jgi:hypothetical protein